MLQAEVSDFMLKEESLHLFRHRTKPSGIVKDKWSFMDIHSDRAMSFSIVMIFWICTEHYLFILSIILRCLRRINRMAASQQQCKTNHSIPHTSSARHRQFTFISP